MRTPKQLAIEEEIEKIEQELLKEQEHWNDIDEVEKLILSFKENLLKTPDLPYKLQFRFLSAGYFSINPENVGNLIEDLNKILKFIAFAKNRGEQKFAFYFM